jgi:hypothetical protein
MNKESSEIVGVIETYIKGAQNLIPEEIGIRITEMLIEQKLVSDLFAIEVIPLKESYILRTRNLYTCDILGGYAWFLQNMWGAVG